MKWLLITKQKRLKKIILQEYKRHPEVFDVIEDFRDCKDPFVYDRVIIGDDVWKKYRMRGSRFRFGDFDNFYYNLMARTIRHKFKYNVVSQCSECKKKGIRLDRGMDSRCKPCRSKFEGNPHAIIVDDFDPEWIEETLSNEPQGVIIINKNLPEEFGVIAQKVIDKYFPEFKGINLRLTTNASGRSLYAWNIALNPNLIERDRQSCIHTIAHELTHQMCLLQGVLRGRSEEVAYLYDQQIPHGELQTEMWTYARHPDLIADSYFWHEIPREKIEAMKKEYGGFTKEFQNEKDKMSLNHMIKHKHKIHELSKQALIKRKAGLVYYRKWFREEMLKIGIVGMDGT